LTGTDAIVGPRTLESLLNNFRADIESAETPEIKLLLLRNAARDFHRADKVAGADKLFQAASIELSNHFADLSEIADMIEVGKAQADTSWQCEDNPLPDAESPPIADAASKSGPSRFVPIWLDDITVDVEPAYIVEGIIPAGPSFGIIPAPPKSLKSFFLIDIFLHVAIGKPYADRHVQQGVVVYITSEGIRGVRRRLVAMRRYHGVEGTNAPFALIPVMPNLGTGRQDLEQLIAEINKATSGLALPVRAVLVDTLRRATPGKSENDPKDMSVFIANCEAIATTFNCFVGAVHHSPRSDDTRGSGTNAIDAAADVILQVSRRNDSASRATVTVGRLKDGDEGDSWTFEVRSMEVGIDRNGAPEYGGYVVITELPTKAPSPATTTRGPSLPRKCKVAMEALAEALAEVGVKPSPSPHIPNIITCVVTSEQWREFAYRLGISNGATARARQKAFKEASEQLRAAHRVGCWDDSIWIVQK
jgi:hypothetical protein